MLLLLFVDEEEVCVPFTPEADEGGDEESACVEAAVTGVVMVAFASVGDVDKEAAGVDGEDDEAG